MKMFLYLGTKTPSPLTLKHRLVWSAVVNCNRTSKKRTGKAATPYLIKKRTGLHHSTITTALAALQSLNLIDQRTVEGRRLIITEEPKGEKAAWFCWRHNLTGKWIDGLAWIVLYQGTLAWSKAERQPSEATEAVYWLLQSMAKRNPEKTYRTSIKRIGLRLGLTAKTVSRALELLARDDIIRFSTDAKGIGFQLLKDLEPAAKPSEGVQEVKPEAKPSEGVQEVKPEAKKRKVKRLTKEEKQEAIWEEEKATREWNKQFLGGICESEGWLQGPPPRLCDHGIKTFSVGRWVRLIRRPDLEATVDQNVRTRTGLPLNIEVWVDEQKWECRQCQRENTEHQRTVLELRLHFDKNSYSFWMDKPAKSGIVWDKPNATTCEGKR